MENIKEGTKIRVVRGDIDTVIHDPYGVVRNIKPNGQCEIHLNYGRGIYFEWDINKIGIGQDIELFDWKNSE